MTITITTPLYYVNDKPHLGSTYTTVACDAYARFQRLEGEDVLFITGVDEHGQKIQRTSEKLSISPQEHCNKVTQKYIDLWEAWSISNDRFVRTTSHNHQSFVAEFFKRVESNGDIRLGKQTGWYCVGCEEYKDVSSESKRPVCPIHLKDLEWRDEENLFFCLSKYQKQISQLVSQPKFIQPESRRNEIISFVEKGLHDFSISRKNVDWGIPVPGFKGHTFYVWFDALLGYISALKPDDKSLDLDSIESLGWPATIHIIGKDILRFHAIYWPAMLISAGFKIPEIVFGHGFLTREGQKMGKTLGNVLDPESLLTKYGRDPIRWYLLSDIKFGHDGDFQHKRFVDLINNDLANTIGNLLNRTITMSRKWFNGAVPIFSNHDMNDRLIIQTVQTIKLVRQEYQRLNFKEASRLILDLSSEANLYLNETEPWRLVKHEDKKNDVGLYLYNVLECTRIVGLLLKPILPDISINILKQLSYKEDITDWRELLEWGVLKQGEELQKPHPLIERIE